MYLFVLMEYLTRDNICQYLFHFTHILATYHKNIQPFCAYIPQHLEQIAGPYISGRNVSVTRTSANYAALRVCTDGGLTPTPFICPSRYINLISRCCSKFCVCIWFLSTNWYRFVLFGILKDVPLSIKRQF